MACMAHKPVLPGGELWPLRNRRALLMHGTLQSEAAAEAADQRLSSLARELEAKAAADGEALRRLQESVAAQQEAVQKVCVCACAAGRAGTGGGCCFFSAAGAPAFPSSFLSKYVYADSLSQGHRCVASSQKVLPI